MSRSDYQKEEEEANLNDMWHFMATILMHKLKKTHLIVTLEEIQEMDQRIRCSVTETDGGLHFSLMDPGMADVLASIGDMKPDGRN